MGSPASTLVLLAGLACAGAHGGEPLDSPRSVLGIDPCAEGAVLDSTQVLAYLRHLERSAGRIRLETFGLSTDGRPLIAAIVSAGENLSRLEELRGSPSNHFVLITCAIHPAEVGATAAGIRLIHRLLSGDASMADEILRRTVLIVVPCMNPDGTDRVAAWLRSGGGRNDERLPFLQHRFTGHDLNRDWLLGTQAETRAAIERLHNRYRPWLTLDVHQMGWNGPRLFVPPYSEPRDPELPADLHDATEALGNRLLDRLTSAGYRGVTRRFGYDAWSPSRAYSPYHGGIRILVEAASCKYQESIDVDASTLRVFGGGNNASRDHPAPWPGGRWGIPQITDYLSAACEAALEVSIEERFQSAVARARSKPVTPAAVRLDADGADPEAAESLLESLELSGVSVEQVLDRASWIARDPAWGQGWCRSLLLSRKYPEVASAPYDTTGHDLARLAGLRGSPLTVSEAADLRPLLRVRTRGAPPSQVRQPSTSSSRKLYLLEPSIPSSEEGWLRWTLEDLRFDFDEIPAERLESLEAEGAGRIVIIAPDSEASLRDGTALELQALVHRGARVIGLGRAARELVREAGLGLVEAGTASHPIHGAVLQTRFGAERAEDPILAGYAAPPAVLIVEGPVWKADNGARSVSLLHLDRESPLVSGLLAPADAPSVRGGSVLVRIRAGDLGGEWILFGFAPVFRGWTSGSVRILCNALSSP